MEAIDTALTAGATAQGNVETAQQAQQDAEAAQQTAEGALATAQARIKDLENDSSGASHRQQPAADGGAGEHVSSDMEAMQDAKDLLAELHKNK